MSLTESAHDAQFLVDDLTRANVNAHPVVHIVLLGLIERAVKLKADVEALQSAIEAGHESHLQPARFALPPGFPGCCHEPNTCERYGCANKCGKARRAMVHHLDGDPSNNAPENLKIVDIAENRGARP